jgi:hypothetical protein
VAISKRLRYEVFRRDDFTCRYCGAKPPEAQLRPDHVIPVALGGTDDPSNLVAACEDCNGGKSSTTPDAPLVAEVADRALEWAAAMRQAQARMLADLKAREADRAQFQEWWDGWHRSEGDTRTQIPKDPAWWVTVDQLIVAGLPLPVLKGCIELAMTQRKVKDEHRFRYMCGVAWNKVKELQKTARQVVGGTVSGQALESQPADPHLAGMVDLANKLLAFLGEEERADALEWVDDREWCKAHNQPILSEDEIVIAAAEQAFESSRITLYRLTNLITNALKQLPDGIGHNAMRDARTALYESRGADFSRDIFVGLALGYLEDEIAYPEAAAYLESLPDGAATEWAALVAITNTDLMLTRKGIAVRAAARAKHGQRLARDRELCRGASRHTPVCLEPVAYLARIAGEECCEKGEHDGHPVCERHLEQLVEGVFTFPDGTTYSATDFTEYQPSEDPWAVPF